MEDLPSKQTWVNQPPIIYSASIGPTMSEAEVKAREVQEWTECREDTISSFETLQ